MSGRNLRDQLKIFFKEKRVAGCPSFFWYFASLTVQVPCFLLWITTIRRMSLHHHEGFDCHTTGETTITTHKCKSPGDIYGRQPYKVACVLWLGVKRACLTQDRLQQREIHLSSICLLCRNIVIFSCTAEWPLNCGTSS